MYAPIPFRLACSAPALPRQPELLPPALTRASGFHAGETKRSTEALHVAPSRRTRTLQAHDHERCSPDTSGPPSGKIAGASARNARVRVLARDRRLCSASLRAASTACAALGEHDALLRARSRRGADLRHRADRDRFRDARDRRREERRLRPRRGVRQPKSDGLGVCIGADARLDPGTARSIDASASPFPGPRQHHSASRRTPRASLPRTMTILVRCSRCAHAASPCGSNPGSRDVGQAVAADEAAATFRARSRPLTAAHGGFDRR